MAAEQSISLGQEAWMNVHKNARLTPYRRAELVERLHAGERGRAVAVTSGISVRTVALPADARRPSRPCCARRGPVSL
jgi:hypothetical protein